jgi:cytochrome P450 family 142 subfamily A polypeptide 1
MNVDVDYQASETWADQEAMRERMRWLRENDPVYWSEKNQFFVLSRFEDIAYVSKHNALFCSGQGVLPGNPAKLGLIDEDEPRHTQLRRLINRGFTPRMVKKLEVVFRDITTEAIDAVAARGECDFVEAISVPLPLLLIAEMIGIRKEDRRRFHEWSDGMILAQGRMHVPEVVERAGRCFAEYAAYVTEIIEDRRKNPRDDLISILVGAKEEGILVEHEGRPEGAVPHHSEEERALANDELIMFCVLLLVAGNETTRNGISGGMQLLIENPGERQKLVEDPSKIPAAVEEMLRLTSPVLCFARTATRDTELRGRPIRAGQKVLMLYPSANRDAEVFEDPDAFRIERNPHHLAFGLGNHFCLGANLARMELRVAFAELLRRIPDMVYAQGGPEFEPSALVRSCSHMHVRFTPERVAA